MSDNPPAPLVARMARTFQSSDGDIRAVMHTMIYSPEFWSREAYRAKIKTPFELVISAVRALGTDVDTPMPLVQWVGRIGEPLYQCQPPTGYADKAEAWVNTGALLNRLNFSLTLGGKQSSWRRGPTLARCWASMPRSPRWRWSARCRFSWRPGRADDGRNAGEAAGQSANFAGQAR